MSKNYSVEALGEFAAEANEIVSRVTNQLQLVERGEACDIDAVYRDMHTLKGTAQLFGFREIAHLAQAMEAVLDPIRRYGSNFSESMIDAMLSVLDAIEARVSTVTTGGGTEVTDEEGVHAVVSALLHHACSMFGALLSLERGEILRLSIPPKEVKAYGAAESAPQSDPGPIAEPMQLHEGGTMSEKIADVAQAPVGETKGESVVSGADSTIRVHVGLLDRLMNLVGELVLVRNQVLQRRHQNEDLEFMNMSKNLDVVTTELQSEVMKTRMQPIGNIITKFQRVVRDLAKELNKKIDLTLQGMETELDKTLLEAIKDPLTHVIRNCCDHGIETPDVRKQIGKPETGHILIRAFHEGGQVIIEISDDGKGLHRDKILAKALEKNIVTQEAAAKMTDRDVLALIFQPGFSTAQQVTAVSGRGVGMDVVRTNIEKIGGNVEILSGAGRGTTLRLKIPLTLAIVPALLVRSGNQKFAVPQLKLVELVRVESGGDQKIEMLQGKPMYRLRGDLLALVSLREVMGEKGALSDENGITNIVVLNAEGECFGLIVDEILDTADIVVKPLSPVLKSIPTFSGATIMGDGSVSLILDVVGIAGVASIDTKKRKSDEGFIDAVASQKKMVSSEVQDFILFRAGVASIHAIPLCLVNRLEEFAKKDIELSGQQQVVKYREALLPLISLQKSLSYDAGGEKQMDSSCTIVVQKFGRCFGLEVDEIMDVISVDSPIDDSVRDRPGILGNLIHNDQVIVVVDALGIIDQHVGHGGSGERAAPLQELRERNTAMKSRRVRVLFVDDVAFFRRQVGAVLKKAGYEVTLAEDGVSALKAIESAGEKAFNVILSDIEMPNMTGLEFAQEVRKIQKLATVPLIALTTRFRQQDIDAGMRAGFDLYLEKLNPEKLVTSIESVVKERAS